MHFHSNSIWRAARRSDGERAGVNNAEGNGGAARAKWEAGDKRLAPQMRLLTDPTESLLPHSKLSSSKAPAPDVTGESCTRDDQSDSAVEDPSREHKSHAAATTPTAAAECQQEQPEGGAAVVQALSSALGASEVSAVPEEAHATAEASLQKGKMVEEQAANAMQEGAGPIAGVNDDKHDVSPASPAGAEPLGGISGFAEGPGTGEESGPEGATGPRLHHEPAQQLGERVGPLSLPPALLACPASDKTSLALAPVQNPDHRPALVPSPRQHQNDSDDLLPPPPARPLQPPAEDQGHIPLQPRALAPHQPAVERETAQQANAGEEKQGEDAQGSSEVLQTATPRTDEHHASAPVEREGGGYMDMMKDSEASVKVDGRGRGKALDEQPQECVTEEQEPRVQDEEDFKPSQPRPVKRAAPDVAPAAGVVDSASQVLPRVCRTPCRRARAGRSSACAALAVAVPRALRGLTHHTAHCATAPAQGRQGGQGRPAASRAASGAARQRHAAAQKGPGGKAAGEEEPARGAGGRCAGRRGRARPGASQCGRQGRVQSAGAEAGAARELIGSGGRGRRGQRRRLQGECGQADAGHHHAPLAGRRALLRLQGYQHPERYQAHVGSPAGPTSPCMAPCLQT